MTLDEIIEQKAEEHSKFVSNPTYIEYLGKAYKQGFKEAKAIEFGLFVEKWGWCKPLCENGGWINDMDEKIKSDEELYIKFLNSQK